MPLSPDFRARSLQLLDTARDDDTLVVAQATPDGGLLMQICTPTLHGLIAIACALLEQARDEMARDDISKPDAELLDRVNDALWALPSDADTPESA